MTQQVRSHKRWTEFLSEEEVREIFSSIVRPRDVLCLRVMWETGARVTEARTLLYENIEQRSNALILTNLKQHARKKGDERPKPPAPLKRVYLEHDSTLIADLLLFCREQHIRSGLVFRGNRDNTKPLSALYIWRILTDACESLQIRHIKKDRLGGYRSKPAWPHLFRHGMAMRTLKRTGRLDVVRDQLGHASIMTTEGYAGLTDDERRRIIQGEKEYGNASTKE